MRTYYYVLGNEVTKFKGKDDPDLAMKKAVRWYGKGGTLHTKDPRKMCRLNHQKGTE